MVILAAVFVVVLVVAAMLTFRPEEKQQLSQTTPPTTTTVPATTQAAPSQAATEATPPETEPTQPEPTAQKYVLTFVGDCTLGNSPLHEYTEGGFNNVVKENYDYPFQNVRAFFENDDFTMVNLEGALGEEGYPAGKSFVFRGPSGYINILTGSSVEAVTLANNHSRDYGQKGYNRTIELLEEADIGYVETDKTAIYTTESGLTIGIFGACFNYPADMPGIVAALREEGAEVIIYAVHWGAEGSYDPRPHQIQQAHDAIDAGVDIVYGSHPHVLQEIESYNGGMIYYSVGNFSFGGNQSPPDFDTVVLQQQVIRYHDGTVELGELTAIPCSVSSVEKVNNYQPTPYAEGSEEYERTMGKLFPEE